MLPLLDVDVDSFSVDEGLPEVSPPMTAAEIRGNYDAFDWPDTVLLSDNNAMGQPALHYALVFVRNTDDEELLELMGIPHDALPFFEQELAQWDGQVGIQSIERIDEGTFVYAILPAEAYNLFRQEALADNAIFDAVVLLDPPVDTAELPDGSLSYDYLAEQDFDYAAFFAEDSFNVGADSVDQDEVDKKRCRRICRRFRRFLRRVARPFRAIVKIGRGVVNAFRVIAGKFRPKRDMRIQLRAANTSDLLFDHPPDSTTGALRDEPQQVWGAKQGAPLRLRGAKMIVRQRMSITIKKLDRNGNVSMRVPRAKKYSILLRLVNPAGRITAIPIWEKRLVLYGLTGRALNPRLKVTGRKNPVVINIHNIKNGDLNALLQVQDGHDLAETVFGIDMPRITVSNGPLKSDDPGPSFAFCLDTYASGRIWPYPGLSQIVFFASGILPFGDLALRDSDDRRRGVIAHEYGHVFMCDALHRTNPYRFGLMFARIAGSVQADNAETPAGYLWEALADWYASQTIGAFNYFDLDESVNNNRGAGVVPRPSEFTMFYCDAVGQTPCLEDNIGGPMQRNRVVSFPQNRGENIARVVSILTDAFDGPTKTPADVLSVGALWLYQSKLPRRLVPAWGRDTDDESITLQPSHFYDFIEKWMNANAPGFERTFTNALAETMRDAGFAEMEICQLFALHASTGDCAELIDSDLAVTTLPIQVTVNPVAVSVSMPSAAVVQYEDFGPGGKTMEIVAKFVDPDGGRETEHARASISYARKGQVTLGPLPFTREMTFVVESYDNVRLLSIGETTAITLAEPVGLVTVVQPSVISWPTLSWEAVNAFEYRIIGQSTDGTAVDVTTRSTTEQLVLSESGTYTVRVFSRDGFGIQQPFGSAPVQFEYTQVVLE